jgi:hypothetical protein
MKIECNVWCVENPTNQDLGLPEGDIWLPCAIDLTKVVAIKLAGENEFIGKGKAVVYINGEHFTIDKSYKELVTQWRLL